MPTILDLYWRPDGAGTPDAYALAECDHPGLRYCPICRLPVASTGAHWLIRDAAYQWADLDDPHANAHAMAGLLHRADCQVLYVLDADLAGLHIQEDQ